MTPALAKLHSKLFSRIKPAQYGLDLETEQVIEGMPDESHRKGNIGGFSWHLADKPNHILTVQHSENSDFNIFVEIEHERLPKIVRIAVSAPFNLVDQEVWRCLQVVRTDDIYG